VRSRELAGNGGKLMASERTKGVDSGRWCDRLKGLVMDKRSHLKSEQDSDSNNDQECLREARGVSAAA